MAANLHTKPIDSGCESAKNWLLPSTSSIAIVISTQPISSYSVFYHPTKNRRLSRPRHCSKGAQAMPRLYVASFVVNTTVCRTFVFSHCSQMHQPLGNCDLLVLAHPGSPGQRAIKRVCVCVSESAWKRSPRYYYMQDVLRPDLTMSTLSVEHRLVLCFYKKCCNGNVK